jgi:hypothetical protein
MSMMAMGRLLAARLILIVVAFVGVLITLKVMGGCALAEHDRASARP